MCNAPRVRQVSLDLEGAASFVAWLRASWPAWKVAIPAPAGGQWVILVRSWLTLDDRYSPYLLPRWSPKRGSWMSLDRSAPSGFRRSGLCSHAEVSSAFPIRHTGICWPWFASSACAFPLSVVDTKI